MSVGSDRLILYVGNRNYSSWSLRPWLAMRWAGLKFDTVEIELGQPGYGVQQVADVLAVSPTGTVPVLHAGQTKIWDSLAICQYAAENARDGVSLWPQERSIRAHAWSISAEMHSGFGPLRQDLPMNILRRCPPQPWRPQTQACIARVEQIWTDCRAAYADAGPWLLGQRSIADAIYAPVATRFRTYGVTLSAGARAWCDTVLNDADFLEWEDASVPESWDSSGTVVIDGLYAARKEGALS
jgi:glutathione S-transferase